MHLCHATLTEANVLQVISVDTYLLIMHLHTLTLRTRDETPSFKNGQSSQQLQLQPVQFSVTSAHMRQALTAHAMMPMAICTPPSISKGRRPIKSTVATATSVAPCGHENGRKH